jgi:tetratricopeptide (TPR) repeat protein
MVKMYGDRSLEIARKLGDVFLESYCLLWLSIQKYVSGRYNEARSFGLGLLEVARRASDPRAMSMGLYALALVNMNQERFEEALENAEEAISIAPDPMAHLAARAAKGMSLALMGRGQEGFDILQEARKEAVEGGFLTIVFFGIDVPYGAAMMLAGQMAAGVRWIEDWIEHCTELGNDAQSAVGHMILGDIYLQMVLGEKKPPLRMVLRNLGFILRTLPVAARKARSHLEEAIRKARPVDMPGILAHSLLDLGLLCQKKKCLEEARQYLEEASQIAGPLESPLLSKKIGAALELLN